VTHAWLTCTHHHFGIGANSIMSTTVFLNKNKENYKMLKDTMMIFEVNMLCFYRTQSFNKSTFAIRL
jgi:hypothetical protein